MTRPAYGTDANPQPTTGEREPDTYLVPRSRTPAKTALYDKLLALGWRFDATWMTWWTPEDWPGREAFGAASYSADLTEAWVQPPTTREGYVREIGTVVPIREPALIRLTRTDDEWDVSA